MLQRGDVWYEVKNSLAYYAVRWVTSAEIFIRSDPTPKQAKLTDAGTTKWKKNSKFLIFIFIGAEKSFFLIENCSVRHKAGNSKVGSITVPLISCVTGLESAVWQLTIFVFICKTD